MKNSKLEWKYNHYIDYFKKHIFKKIKFNVKLEMHFLKITDYI